VTLASAPVQATTIGFSTQDFSAVAGSDYTSTSGNLVIPVGQTSGTISIPIVGDTTAEKVEAFYVNLTSTDNGSLNPTKKQAAIGIFDNDKSPFPTVSLPKRVSVAEGDRGASNILFRDGSIAKYDKAVHDPAMRHIDYGLNILTRAAFAGFAEEKEFDLAAVFQRLLAAGHLAAFEVPDRFYEIGSREGLADLEAFLRS